MEKMNVAMLYKKLYEKLKGMDGLTKMYIGKTKDLQATKERHEREGYANTDEIAYGDVQIVSEGEIYLIKKFKESDLNCKNDNDGGGPDEANRLYVSYSSCPKYESIHDLENGELDWVVIELVK